MSNLTPEQSVFDRAFSEALGHEGAFSNHSADRGGPTKYGITLKTYRQYYPTADIDTIRNLTVEQAKTFYFEHFWSTNNYDKIKVSDLAVKIFVACINMGPYQAHLCLQRALNCVGFKLSEDGQLGIKTLEAINRTGNPEWNFAILCTYRSELAGFYRVLAAKDATQKEFLNGWLKRAYA